VSANGQEAADKFSAKPGQSEHQTGLAIDITCEAMNYQLDYSFGVTDEGAWVKENAHRFGFIIRYPEGKEDITGYMYEPWHLRYVGVDLAEEVYNSGLTLEEYFETFE
jgi:D-alanyl-D-alanine carboxypeptidase